MSIEYEIVPGYVIQLDKSDLSEVKKHRWVISRDKKYSVVRLETTIKIERRKYRRISLQNFLIQPMPGLIVKFRNQDCFLDFRRSNLEIVTSQDQSRRCRKRVVQTTSVYRGVSFRKDRQKWAVMIKINSSHNLFIGYFNCEHEAALEWNKASRRYFGELGFQNIIVWFDKNIEEIKK